jgi:hypothetical protein
MEDGFHERGAAERRKRPEAFLEQAGLGGFPGKLFQRAKGGTHEGRFAGKKGLEMIAQSAGYDEDAAGKPSSTVSVMG